VISTDVHDQVLANLRSVYTKHGLTVTALPTITGVGILGDQQSHATNVNHTLRETPTACDFSAIVRKNAEVHVSKLPYACPFSFQTLARSVAAVATQKHQSFGAHVPGGRITPSHSPRHHAGKRGLRVHWTLAADVAYSPDTAAEAVALIAKIGAPALVVRL